jgi:hypothetical protein
MGHAALLKHHDKYNPNSTNVMSFSKTASDLLPIQVSKIWRAYYAHGDAPEKGWEDFVAD